MRTIEIDDEVYSYLQSQAIPFEENSPNATIRRLFNLNSNSFSEVTKIQRHKSRNRKKKQPKTNLLALIKVGLIKEDQTLYLYDYQGNKIEGYEATIKGKLLSRNDKLFSMSKLAEMGLKEHGLTSNSVQGPARWYNSDGMSILKLWTNFLKKGE